MEHIKNHKELQHYFQNMDHVDIKAIDGTRSLREFIAGMLSYQPWWIALLFKIRELFVIILGLVKHEKSDFMLSIKPENLSFETGDKATFFIVHSAKEDAYWVAKSPEDKHLSAYIGIVKEELSEDTSRFYVFTTVKYLHWTGPVYFNIIRPFHHLVVWRMMKAGIKECG